MCQQTEQRDAIAGHAHTHSVARTHTHIHASAHSGSTAASRGAATELLHIHALCTFNVNFSIHVA